MTAIDAKVKVGSALVTASTPPVAVSLRGYANPAGSSSEYVAWASLLVDAICSPEALVTTIVEPVSGPSPTLPLKEILDGSGGTDVAGGVGLELTGAGPFDPPPHSTSAAMMATTAACREAIETRILIIFPLSKYVHPRSSRSQKPFSAASNNLDLSEELFR